MFASDKHNWDQHGIHLDAHSGHTGVLQTPPLLCNLKDEKSTEGGGSTALFASDTHNLENHKEGLQVLSMCMVAFQAIMWDQQQ